MEIKKADSKGRVTGFEPGKYYSVVRDSTGTGFALNQLHEGGYTGTRDEPHGIVHESVLYEDGRFIPGASISSRHEDGWWDSDYRRWVYPSDD